MQKIIDDLKQSQYSVVHDFLTEDECEQIQEIMDDALEDEEYENGVVFRSIPKAFLTVMRSSATKKILELTDKSLQNEIVKCQSDDYIEDLHIVYKIGFEIFEPGSSNERKSYIDRFKDSVSLKLFISDGDFQVYCGDQLLTVSSGGLATYADRLSSTSQVVNSGTENLYVVTISIKTEMVNPKIVHNASDSKVGVIIDCKDTESPSELSALEYGLANFTRQQLVKNGFNNITAFISRKDFDTCVQTLKDAGVEKAFYIFAGTIVDQNTYEKVKYTSKLTAWKEGDIVYRRYLIFDVSKYDYFQIKGEFLSNVIDDITNVSPEHYGIYYLQPDTYTYEFLEDIFNGLVPDIKKLGNASQLEIFEAEKIISGISDIVLNTV